MFGITCVYGDLQARALQPGSHIIILGVGQSIHWIDQNSFNTRKALVLHREAGRYDRNGKAE